jgi:DNA-binding MarR family transcriptional regulator
MNEKLTNEEIKVLHALFRCGGVGGPTDVARAARSATKTRRAAMMRKLKECGYVVIERASPYTPQGGRPRTEITLTEEGRKVVAATTV